MAHSRQLGFRHTKFSESQHFVLCSDLRTARSVGYTGLILRETQLQLSVTASNKSTQHTYHTLRCRGPLRSHTPLYTACCDEVDPYSILKSHGCLLRRPQKENRRSRRKARNEKERGRPSVRGEPLLSQALREEVSPRKLAFARQSTRPKPEDRRVCQQTAGSRPQGAALRQAPPEMRVPQSTGGIEGEQIYSLPRSQTDRVHQKKRAVGASERNEWLRAAWKVTVAGVLDPRRLVFVDECGTHVSLAPIYGYSARGERVRLKVPRNRGKNTTLLASMSTEGMGPCLAVEGSTTAEVFEAYLEHSLAPKLKE